jgi:hypothetical protein
MKEEKLNKIAVQAGFIERTACCECNSRRIYSPNYDSSIEHELNFFKNLLLDEVIKELNALSGEPSLGLVTDILIQMPLKAAIEKVEAMK